MYEMYELLGKNTLQMMPLLDENHQKSKLKKRDYLGDKQKNMTIRR